MNCQEFEDKIAEWLEFLRVEKNVSQHTFLAYRRDLGQLTNFWKSVLSSEKDSHVLTFDIIIRRFIVSLFYKKISSATLSRKISCVRSLHKYFKVRGINFTLNVQLPKKERKLPVVLSVDEIFHILDNVKNEDLPTKLPLRDKAIVEVFYATGIRCSELVNIRIDEIDFVEKTIRILGKGMKERIVLFGSKAKNVLIDYMEQERIMLAGKTSSPYLFLNSSGTNLTSRSIQRTFEMFRSFLKIDRHFTPHKLRHSFATHLLNAGVDLRVIQELLGHASLSATEIYTHVSSADLAEMCDKMHPLNKMEI